MKIAIVYESLSGNTKLIAEKLNEQLEKEGEVIYFGNSIGKIPKADIYFIGSWTDKGNATKKIQETLRKMKNSKIAYFGTAGFEDSEEYYTQLFERINENIDSSNEILGYFFCQGKMPIIIKQRYEKQLEQNPNDKETKKYIKNFEKALKHPNSKDLINIEEWSKKIIKNIEK